MHGHWAVRHKRIILLILACCAGYLIGTWHSGTARQVANAVSAAQTVALRFPESQETAPAAEVPTGTLPNAAAAVKPVSAKVLGDTHMALLSPQPMLVVPQASTRNAPEAAPAPAAEAVPSPPRRPAVARHTEPKPAETARASRPGFVLNDAQITSIKKRLHLTSDQESMWPAVEAALRNIAYTRAQEARRAARGGATDVASLDPNSAAVQDLKSAAVPLIMSFDDDQKNEVRSLAHVMGLDKLASQF